MTTLFAAGVGTAYVGAATIALVADPRVDARLVAAVDDGIEIDELVTLLARRPSAAAISFTHDDAALHVAHHGAISIEIDEHPFAAGSGDRWHRHRLLIGSATSTTVTLALDRHVFPFAGSHRVEAGVVPAAAVRCSFGPLDDAFGPIDALLCPTMVAGGRPADDGIALARDRPLGVLVFSTGERVLLDRTMVLGRNPYPVRQHTPDDSAQPRMVRVAAPGVSRQHALLRIEGRRLTIDDLGSANGTRVVAPGLPTRTVVPGVPITLVSGMIVELGSEVSFAVEEVA